MTTTAKAPPARSPGAPTEPPEPYRAPWLAAGLAAFAVWLLYAFTLAPTTAFWDTSEYIATAHIMGIPHPPGNPLFVVLARAWDLVLAPTGLSVAIRINLFSATMSAFAHGFWFLLADRILAFFSRDRWFRLIGAAAAVAISATAFTVWNQSNVNEKVYTVTLFTIALLSWLAFRWRDHVGEGKDDNLILLMVFILALSVGNHLMAFLAAPALIVFILLVHPKTLANWKLYATAAVAGFVGLSIHLFLPIRAGLSPIINEADPTCSSLVSAIQSILTMGASGCRELSEALQRQQYDKPSMFVNPVSPWNAPVPRDIRLLFGQVLNYVQYFDWQWARMISGTQSWFGGLRPLFTLLFCAFGIYGAYMHYQRDRVSFAYVAVLFATVSMGLVFYLNFKYGYSVPQALMDSDTLRMVTNPNDAREVRERDYFFIVSFSLWGLWSGIGLAALWQALGEWIELRSPDVLNPRTLAAPVMAFALLPLALNWTWASRRDDYTARDWSYNLLMSLDPYAIVFTNGDNDTFPLWYLQEVEGLRRDVTVMVMSYLNTPWYVRQIRDLTAPCPAGVNPLADATRIICQRPFEADKAPGLYGEMMVPLDQPGIDIGSLPPGRRPPVRSIIPLTNEEIARIATVPMDVLREEFEYRAGQIVTTLPRGTFLAPADVFMAQMIQNAIDDRPVYYAMTTAAYESLQLRPYLIRQGVAFRLNNGPVQPDSTRGIYEVSSDNIRMLGTYVDLPRTETLLEEYFVHRGGFPTDWNHWVDAATAGIPIYYAFTHYSLSDIYEAMGDTAKALYHYGRFDDFYRLAEGR